MNGEASDSESVVRDVASVHSSSCTPSTSGASSPSYSLPRRRKSRVRKQASRNRYLLAIEDRNRLRKLAARKVRIAANAVSATTFLRWKKKIDEKFEKQFEERRGSIRRLQQENDLLRVHHRTFVDGCNALGSYAMMLQLRLEQQFITQDFEYQSPDDFYFPRS